MWRLWLRLHQKGSKSQDPANKSEKEGTARKRYREEEVCHRASNVSYSASERAVS